MMSVVSNKPWTLGVKAAARQRAGECLTRFAYTSLGTHELQIVMSSSNLQEKDRASRCEATRTSSEHNQSRPQRQCDGTPRTDHQAISAACPSLYEEMHMSP